MATNSKLLVTEYTDTPARGITLPAEEQMKSYLEDLPVASPTQDGLYTPEYLKGWVYKRIPVPSGETRLIGAVSGLCSMEVPYQEARPTLFLVNPYFREVLKLIGPDTIQYFFRFSFDEENQLLLYNPRDYDIIAYVSYQKIGKRHSTHYPSTQD